MPSYLASRELASVFDLVHVAPSRDGWVAAYSGTSEIMLLNRDGLVRRVGRLPSGGRPSVTGSIWPTLQEDRLPYAELISSVAPMRLLAEVGTDELLVVHLELVRAGRDNGADAFWASMVRSDLTEACLGPRVQLDGVGQPAFATRGDTLMAVQRKSIGADVATTLRRWIVDSDSCEWQPLAPPLHEGATR